MTDLELKELAAKAEAAYNALSSSQKLRHDYAQRRSFACGMCPSHFDYEAWCLLINERMPDEKELTDAKISLILLDKLVHNT